MNDQDFMLVLREAPSERFTADLRKRLRRIDADSTAGVPRAALWRFAAAVAIAIGIGTLFALPVRATAEQFLDLFRVTSFVAVPVQEGNMERLKDNFDLSRLIGEQVEVLPARPTRRSFETVQDAAAFVGMDLSVPHYLPHELAFTGAQVESGSVTRVVASTAKLRNVMELFDIRDLSVPDSLDGEVVIVTVPAIALLTYESARSRLELAQARAPQVSLPAGIDLPTLGEIGLRILGLSPGEAQNLAQTIDWRSTLVVPMSPSVESFQQITIQGRPAVHMVSRQGNERQAVLWSDGERVYALRGALRLPELIAVANSLGPA